MALEGEYKISIERSADDVGLGLAIFKMDDQTYFVHTVKDIGLVPTWNAKNTNSPEVQVRNGDYITAVNGVSGDHGKMMEQLKEKTLSLTLRHGASDGSRSPLVSDAPSRVSSHVSRGEGKAPVGDFQAWRLVKCSFLENRSNVFPSNTQMR
eukprot:TRINITY_DN20002_c0_g1_i3.p1 TRINITY_DN20002_c0_g1~~TRINITY_DN20002_c0_g1_i3.p1  ORF type:complete len:152 (-),score=23.94 TRINITY_DN20002_c0_g1_i3:30-485(-)